jgi:energy-coupling factor transporter ATP-binding protein EcfA2
MRITKIAIKDFRAFRGAPLEIDLSKEGKNLLVYGENGSGKTSLFNALKIFFDSNIGILKFADYRHFKVATNDGYVRIDIGDGTNAPTTYEWDETANPSKQQIISEAAKTKGFLDYRSLLETHFVQRKEKKVNIFDLTVNTLLGGLENPISKVTFQRDYSSAMYIAVKERRGKSRTSSLAKKLDDFNNGLRSTLNALQLKANEILSLFEHNVSIFLEMHPKGVIPHAINKALDNSIINLSIYLAALLQNPPSQLRLLFLDDVLIGLDMSNRLPLLDVLAAHFADWQIFLTTYDHVWFSMVRKRVEDLNPKWEFAEFYCGKSDEGDIPIYAKDKQDYLTVANNHLQANDLKAAAIYIRSAYEHEMKHFASRHGLHIRYCDNPKDLKAEYFWDIIKKTQLKTGDPAIGSKIITDVELFRATILNQLSHTAPISITRQEVVDAKKAIQALKSCFESIHKHQI